MFVSTLIQHKRLSLTSLGRLADLPVQEHSGIRRADRFLSNNKLHEEREIIYKIIANKLIGNNKHPHIIVDWSVIPNTTHQLLRAALVTKGRALSLYEEVHVGDALGTQKVHNAFLDKLKSFLPKECKPTIITDAGFTNYWFKKVIAIGWNFVGRIRGLKCIQVKDTGWILSSKLIAIKPLAPKYLGLANICRVNTLTAHLFSFKAKKKGRIALNKFGEKRKSARSIEYSKGAKEGWLLVSSLSKGNNLAKKVIKKYSLRMQIEEGFRDLKSTRFGFGLTEARSKNIKRIEILLLIAMLASLIAWITGYIIESMGLHYQFQSNSQKNKRVLSLFFLGCQAIRRKIKIPITYLFADERRECLNAIF